MYTYTNICMPRFSPSGFFDHAIRVHFNCPANSLIVAMFQHEVEAGLEALDGFNQLPFGLCCRSSGLGLISSMPVLALALTWNSVETLMADLFTRILIEPRSWCTIKKTCAGRSQSFHVCDMTHSYVIHHLFIRVTWLVNTCSDDDCFISISSLAPLIEGGCSSNSISIRVLGFKFTFFALLLRKKKYVQEKKQLVIPPSRICIHMCTLYTYTNTYLPRFSPSGYFGSSTCLVPTFGLTSSIPCAVCVCVYVYTHIHSPTLPPASKIEKTQENISISPSVKNNICSFALGNEGCVVTTPPYKHTYKHVYMQQQQKTFSKSIYIHIHMHLKVFTYTYTYTYIHVCNSSSRNFAHSSRRAAVRQHALLRSPVFTLPTLHSFLSGACHLMTHGSNLTWWVMLCRCDFLLVSRCDSKLKAGKITHLKGGGVSYTYKLGTFSSPRWCKTSSVGQSAGLLILRSSVRFRQKLKKPRTQIYMDLSYIDPQARVVKLLLQVIKAIINLPQNTTSISVFVHTYEYQRPKRKWGVRKYSFIGD